MRRAAIRLALVGALVGAFAPVAQAGSVLTVVPPGTGEVTAECVGPDWDKTAAVGNMAPWNAHWNGEAPDGTSAVIHDFACDH